MGCALGVEHIKAVFHVGKELLGRIKTLGHGEAHVVAFKRVRHHQMRWLKTAIVIRQVIGVAVGVVDKAPLFYAKTPAVVAGASLIKPEGALAEEALSVLRDVVERLAAEGTLADKPGPLWACVGLTSCPYATLQTELYAILALGFNDERVHAALSGGKLPPPAPREGATQDAFAEGSSLVETAALAFEDGEAADDASVTVAVRLNPGDE